MKTLCFEVYCHVCFSDRETEYFSLSQTQLTEAKGNHL